MKYALFEFKKMSDAQAQMDSYSRIGWTVHTLRICDGAIILLMERKEV